MLSMKRKKPESKITKDETITKKQKITKSLEALLAQVSQGQYEEFREYLELNKMKKLDLRYKVAINTNLFHLFKALEGTDINALYLDYNNIGVKGAEEIALALPGNKSLQTLTLNGNDLGANGVKNLALGLKDNQSLHTLELSFNQIDSDGARYIGEALIGNQSLHTLDLSFNQIGSEGAMHIGKALKSNQSLHILSLMKNQIGSGGAEELLLALKGNQVLHTLNLSFNQISSGGAKYAGRALQGNQSLRTLFLMDNQIGLEGAEELLRSLKGNQSLHTLDLSDNEAWDSANAEALSGYIKHTGLLDLGLDTVRYDLYMRVVSAAPSQELRDALVANSQKLIMTPYYLVCARYLSQESKRSQNQQYQDDGLAGLPPSRLSSEQQSQYAGGILTADNLPSEIFEHILTFLPCMRSKSVVKMTDTFFKKHKEGSPCEVTDMKIDTDTPRCLM